MNKTNRMVAENLNDRFESDGALIAALDQRGATDRGETRP